MKPVLADTSVWIEFFRGDERAAGLAALLDDERVVVHPWVLGELTLGQLTKKGKRRKQRRALLEDLERLPAAPSIGEREMLELAERRDLVGRGIGWVDVQLVGSALAGDCRLWTLDRKLAAVAEELALSL